MKFRKKPIVIEAIQWTGENWEDIIPFVDSEKISMVSDGDILKIKTLEGTMDAIQGDWIIKGIKGEYYPCKPDIFLATYEKVEN